MKQLVRENAREFARPPLQFLVDNDLASSNVSGRVNGLPVNAI